MFYLFTYDLCVSYEILSLIIFKISILQWCFIIKHKKQWLLIFTFVLFFPSLSVFFKQHLYLDFCFDIISLYMFLPTSILSEKSVLYENGHAPSPWFHTFGYFGELCLLDYAKFSGMHKMQIYFFYHHQRRTECK